MKEIVKIILEILTACFGLLAIFSSFFFTSKRRPLEGFNLALPMMTKKTIAFTYLNLVLFLIGLGTLIIFQYQSTTLTVIVFTILFIIIISIVYGIKYAIFSKREF